MESWDGRGSRDNRGSLVFGLLLIGTGILFLAGQQLDVSMSDVAWPAYIIVPGLVLFLGGLLFRDEAGLGMTVPGGIVTATGLLLLYQSTYDAYATWAYAWSLIAPGSVGVSLFVWGLLHRRWDLVDAGLRTAATGLGLFVGFGLFFENVIGLGESGSSDMMRTALPLLVAVLGVIIIAVNLMPRPSPQQEPGETQSEKWVQGPPGA